MKLNLVAAFIGMVALFACSHGPSTFPNGLTQNLPSGLSAATNGLRAITQSVSHDVLQGGSGPKQWASITLPHSNSYATQVIAREPNGNIWFTSDIGSGEGFVGYVRMDRTVTQFPASIPGDIAAGQGGMWFVEKHPGSPDTQTVDMANDSGIVATYAVPSGEFVGNLCYGDDANIWFADFRTLSVGKITPSGTITEYRVPSSRIPDFCHKGPDGAVWFTEINSQGEGGIARVDPQGKITEFPLVNHNPTGITLGPDGDLWFTLLNENSIGKMNTSGNYTIYPLNKQLNPVSIVTGADKKLWFTLQGGIASITTSGVISYHNDPFFTGFFCVGIAAGADENLWMTNDDTNHAAHIDVFIYRVITVNPTSLTLNVGQQAPITVRETHYSGSWTANSSNQSVATVSTGGGRNNFNVEALASGITTITVSDNSGNLFEVSVTVN